MVATAMPAAAPTTNMAEEQRSTASCRGSRVGDRREGWPSQAGGTSTVLTTAAVACGRAVKDRQQQVSVRDGRVCRRRVVQRGQLPAYGAHGHHGPVRVVALFAAVATADIDAECRGRAGAGKLLQRDGCRRRPRGPGTDQHLGAVIGQQKGRELTSGWKCPPTEAARPGEVLELGLDHDDGPRHLVGTDPQVVELGHLRHPRSPASRGPRQRRQPRTAAPARRWPHLNRCVRR